MVGEATDSIPVWVMRQAGRYLPEFRSVREKYEFLEVCKDPLLASEVTLQPVRRFPLLDAVIIFSDILVVPLAMGQPLSMGPGGPSFGWNVTTPSDVSKLNLSPDIEATLGYVFDAIYMTKKRLQNAIPLIGFCGGPFTTFAYMVDGSGRTSFSTAKKWVKDYSEASHILLKTIANVSAQYLIGQYKAGVRHQCCTVG